MGHNGAAIYQAVTDYYEGWYNPDIQLMDRALHADLTKRVIKVDPSGNEYLDLGSKELMLSYTRQGGGSSVPIEKKQWSITILDSYEEIATVRVASAEYLEYIHLARQNGQWLVVNVLYTLWR